MPTIVNIKDLTLPVSADELYKGQTMLGPEAIPMTRRLRVVIDHNNKPTFQRWWHCRVGNIWLEIPQG